MAPIAVAVYNWTGFYAGLNVGYGWGTGGDPSLSFVETSGSGLTGYVAAGGIVPVTANPEGVIGGGQIGYNWQTSNLVWGFVTDFQASGMNATTRVVTTPPGNLVIGRTTFDRKMDWFGTVRAKAGWAVVPNLLLYATGGLAYGNIEETLTFRSSGAPRAVGSSSHTKIGWTVGAGFEYGFSAWSFGVEYLYMDLGKTDTTMIFAGYPGAGGDSLTMTSRNASHIVRGVLNYRF